jgi:hypothetical protein
VHAGEGDEKHTNWLLLEILTPIVKTYSAEQGSRSAALAIQTLGGYGFTTDFPVQQHYRDLKIMSLYEGTTGIQSLDLLGRKVTMDNGKALEILATTIQQTITEALAITEIADYANQLANSLGIIKKVLNKLLPLAATGKLDLYLADATVFLEMMSYTVIGWQWLKMGLIASQQMAHAQGSQQQLYEGKIHTMKFYFVYEMPHAKACAETLLTTSGLSFVKDHELFA